ncbi:HAMP domain-containing sensor histidine kinase [Cohnella sp. AR92]|uniref:HAMP domain-containing sensor histidine kinase n=1 Tax=Cohnella sp. AR92 TaxID=648716 RepID=UPI000F8E876F|nr:HAMP domain-containing sensor histidine kinase [Cohnella sp. AR92]RUS45162.1 HAMP domain-containing histidine kinase [Cohnella sp. AR92]
MLDSTTSLGKPEYIPLLVVGSLVVFILVFLLFFYLLTKRIMTYFAVLIDGLGMISQGDLEHRVPVRRDDELGTLARNMNIMAEQLAAQKRKEKETEESKMNLITGVSHDLRTPLTSMIGYLDLLRKRSYSDENEYDRFVNNAFSKAQQLKKLIDDLLTYTRLTSGDMVFAKQRADMRELLEQVLFEFVPIAEEYHAVVRSEIGIQKAAVHIDPEQIARILDNLLMNSLKYSTDPKVIDIRLTSDKTSVYLTIGNEGEPITEEQEAKLFDRFYKTEKIELHSHLQSGAGLGLAIARQLAERQDGSLTLEYENGHYAFTLKLPLLQNDGSPEPLP